MHLFPVGVSAIQHQHCKHQLCLSWASTSAWKSLLVMDNQVQRNVGSFVAKQCTCYINVFMKTGWGICYQHQIHILFLLSISHALADADQCLPCLNTPYEWSPNNKLLFQLSKCIKQLCCHNTVEAISSSYYHSHCLLSSSCCLITNQEYSSSFETFHSTSVIYQFIKML